MRKLILIIVALAVSSLALALEVAGVKIDEKASVGGSDLVLNGAGLRKKAFFKVYVGALYLTQKQNNIAAIVALKGPRRVQMSLLRDLTADQLVDALVEGLAENHSKAEMEGMKREADQLSTIMRGMKEVKSGQVVTLDFVPGTGTVVSLNGSAKGTIAGDAFNNALLKIWLGDHPVSDSLKKEMLGS